ncbi:DUF58 domain-containing protein [Zooshikella sp. RANM57]|uniref:DUF58 domain-containing protein n=1 Tax=Zooshikella sp. RANM57 TaxID=3425863 RepID=UPI003D6FF043
MTYRAYSSLDDLIQLRLHSKELSLFRPRIAKSALSGQYRSSRKGRGIEFAEVRVYQPGDDVRTIDWRVTARSQEPHTKVFQEERERPVFILVDQSQSLFFGSQGDFKSVIAAEAGSAIAWAALANSDRVGGIVFSEKGHQEIKPRRQKKAVLQLLHNIHAYNHELSMTAQLTKSSTHFADVLGHACRLIKPGSTVAIFSDFQQFSERARQYLSRLASHNDVLMFPIQDPLESQLPPPGNYTFTDGQHRCSLNTQQKQLRQRFAEQAQQHQQTLTAFCRRYRMAFHPLTTQQSAVDQLKQVFHSPWSKRVV